MSLSGWVKNLQNASREKKIALAVSGAVVALGAAAYSLADSKKTEKNIRNSATPLPLVSSKKKKAKAAVDREFLRQFVHFFPIIVPGMVFICYRFLSLSGDSPSDTIFK